MARGTNVEGTHDACRVYTHPVADPNTRRITVGTQVATWLDHPAHSLAKFTILGANNTQNLFTATSIALFPAHHNTIRQLPM